MSAETSCRGKAREREIGKTESSACGRAGLPRGIVVRFALSRQDCGCSSRQGSRVASEARGRKNRKEEAVGSTAMCGIVGKLLPPGRGPLAREFVEDMCAALEHRGPDSRGVFLEDGIGLGIQRLRVVDLVTGDQPIFNEDGSVVVVLNGEIYNFRELRRGPAATRAIASLPMGTPR